MADSSFPIPRHWWGKIVGGLLGLFKGSLSGAVLGVILGHVVDRMIFGLSSKARTRTVFFTSLFACLGHVNKADGRVSEVEIASAENLMRRLELDAEERKEAIRSFNHGKQAAFDLEGELQEFIAFTRTRPDLRQMFMEVLLEGAATDGRIDEREQVVLVRVARAVRIPGPMFAAMFAAFTASHGPRGYTPGAAAAGQDLSQAYATLGIKSGATDQEVKKAYRRLVGQYHPDRLVARGLPEDMMETAKARISDINLAYDRIKESRGFK